MIWALIIYVAFTIFLWRYLLPSQFASPLSSWYLFIICLFWPLWVGMILIIDVSMMFWPIKVRKFEDIKRADPGPRKKEK